MCTLAKEVEFVQFLSDMKRFNIYFSVCVHWAEVQFVKFWPDVKKTQYLFLRECTLGKEVQFVQLCSDLKRLKYLFIRVCSKYRVRRSLYQVQLQLYHNLKVSHSNRCC